MRKIIVMMSVSVDGFFEDGTASSTGSWSMTSCTPTSTTSSVRCAFLDGRVTYELPGSGAVLLRYHRTDGQTVKTLDPRSF